MDDRHQGQELLRKCTEAYYTKTTLALNYQCSSATGCWTCAFNHIWCQVSVTESLFWPCQNFCFVSVEKSATIPNFSVEAGVVLRLVTKGHSNPKKIPAAD